jgi:type IV pilus assembly protein PilA
MTRPGIVTLLAVLQFIGGAFMALGAIVTLAGSAAGDTAEFRGVLIVIAVLCLVFAAIQFVCGVGLLKLKPYGRTIMIALSVLGLFGFPFGTVIAILVLIYLFRPGVKILFSGQPSESLAPEQTALVEGAKVSPVVLVIIGVVLVGGLVIVGGIMAAIAVPGLLRARQAGNEASAIASLRAINSAEMAYAAGCADGGFAVALDDLVKPPRSGGPAFVSEDLSRNGVEKSGYRLRVEPGRGASRVTAAAATCNGSSADAVSAYFAVAEPVTFGQTGSRYFATDSMGAIFASASPIANPIQESPAVTLVR